MNSLLFQITNKRVAESGIQKVGEHKHVEEDSLRNDYEGSEGNARVPLVEEGEEVKTLVVSFLQQVVNPAVVSLHQS